MNTWIRRTLIGVGAALLVGGWGTTRYYGNPKLSKAYRELVAEFVQIIEDGAARRGTRAGARARDVNADKEIVRVSAKDIMALMELGSTYTTGVWLMASGAGLIGFGAIRTNKEAG